MKAAGTGSIAGTASGAVRHSDASEVIEIHFHITFFQLRFDPVKDRRSGPVISGTSVKDQYFHLKTPNYTLVYL